MKQILSAAIFGTIILLGGCAGSNSRVLGTENQVQSRNMQSRSFDTGDKTLVMRNVISTMQDLGFIIDKADEKLGMVSATSFRNNSKMTVSVRGGGDANRTIVRANAQSGLSAIDSPAAYQNFFNALSQSMFLDANDVD
jgi:hypothetical protein